MSSTLEPMIYGLALGGASTLSVGPNNLMLIREGLSRGRVGFVATSVWLSYMSLLVLAFLLAGSIATEAVAVRSVLADVSLAALAAFAFLSLRSAFRADILRPRAAHGGEAPGACLRRVCTVVWLNPLTYIELLLIPSSICDGFERTDARLQFILGLVAVETIACYGYSFGAGFCAPLFRHRRSLQLFDLASGLVMTGMALAVAAGMTSLAG